MIKKTAYFLLYSLPLKKGTSGKPIVKQRFSKYKF